MAEFERNNQKWKAAEGVRAREGKNEDTVLMNRISDSYEEQKGQDGEDAYPLLGKDNKKFFAIVTIHDVAPEYSDKIFRAADELQKLGIHYNLAIIPYLKKKEENLVTNNPEFVNRILRYGQDIAVHGNYHETEDGKIEDFHTFSKDEAKNHLQNAINILKEAGINHVNVFVPPTWAINQPAIDDLIQLGFALTESKEEILLLMNSEHKEKSIRLHGNVLNWDQSGSPQKNKQYLANNKQLFKLRVIQGNSQVVRLAIHPRDAEDALQDQIEMIHDLKDMNYSFLGYGEIIRMVSLQQQVLVAEKQKEEEVEKILSSSQRAQLRRS
jgi:predicted deacetylase